MSDYTIYHNPRCSKSRNTLALLQEHGIEPEIVLYLETAPSASEITGLLDKLGIDAAQLVRRNEEAFKVAGLGKDSTDEELLAAMGPVKSELEAIDRLVTAQKFVCPSMLQAATMSQNNARTWFYLFARQRAGEMAASMGAYHGAELPYVFDTHDPWLPTNADDRQVTRQLMNAWVHFARHGSPGNVEGERWPEFRLADSMTMIFDTVPQLAVHRDRNLCNLLSAPTR